MIDFNATGIIESTAQHQKDILISDKGWFKFSPHIAVGIDEYIDDDSSNNTITQKIGRNFRADGMIVDKIKITDKISIDAHY